MPETDAFEDYMHSLERLTLIGATVEEKERAAFEAGRKSRDQDE